MSSSREESPDWLRCFQAPTHSTLTLSSDSASSPNDSPSRENKFDYDASSPNKSSKFLEENENHDIGFGDSVVESPSNRISKEKSPKKWVEDHLLKKENNDNDEVIRAGYGGDMKYDKEEAAEKLIESHVSSSRIPLVLSEKVHCSKALVECEGESIDLSGDMGAVGRIVIPDGPSGNELYLDLKGTIYRTTIVPSRTFCVVSFGHSEAKIEAIMNDFIQLKPQSNVYEAETMVEGTLDGFSFDSEDEADKMPKSVSHQTDHNEGIEEQTNGKPKGKAENPSVGARKKVKIVGGKPQPAKRARKKSQFLKKTKMKTKTKK